MIQERRHLRKDVPQMVKQQLPKHQLHKNNSHKVSPSLNNSHKARPSLNNIHKVRSPLDTQQEHVPSQFRSDDDEPLPNPFPTSTKTFEMKDPKFIPKKPKYSLRPK